MDREFISEIFGPDEAPRKDWRDWRADLRGVAPLTAKDFGLVEAVRAGQAGLRIGKI